MMPKRSTYKGVCYSKALEGGLGAWKRARGLCKSKYAIYESL